MKGLVIAGTHSGAGKTTVTLALMAALRRKGLRVQGFKVGPDFIDPGHHGAVTGRPSHNLDGWMLPKDENLDVFSRYAAGADAAVVEGVMGLYDGYDGRSEAGSTAQMAKWLGLPVLLCVDARSMARSLGALAYGFAGFDPDLTWVGLVANRIGSDRHLEMLAQAMESVHNLDLIGGLARRPDIELSERHLGLVTADETTWSGEAVSRLADWIANGIDLDRLWDSLPDIKPPLEKDLVKPVPTSESRVRIGVARDEAFCFYYRENLRRLEAAGAELVYFSPIRDRGLPDGLAGLYLGGGYPEIFARELSANEAMRESVFRFGNGGGVIYAECGGFMYLARRLEDTEGRRRPMAGLLPVDIRMLGRLRSLGYRAVTLTGESIIGPPDTEGRGHEFHYSEITRADTEATAFRLHARDGQKKESAGYMKDNILASYIHLHFGSNPRLALNLVEHCRRRSEGSS